MSLEDGTQYSIRSIKEESQNIICQVTNESLQNKSNEFVPCATDDVRHYIDDHSIAHSRSKDNCKIVAISIHTDYALFQKMSLSSEKVSNYILSIFNNVQERKIYKFQLQNCLFILLMIDFHIRLLW